MDSMEYILSKIKEKLPTFSPLATSADYNDEVRLKVSPQDFKSICLVVHKVLSSPVMMLFAVDERSVHKKFIVNCVFVDMHKGFWVTVSIDVPEEAPWFESLSKEIYSASLFEREIWEMFGLEPRGNPDLRSLHLHDEIWPRGNFPLRKNFRQLEKKETGEYQFTKVEGEGVFEVPVGPVHAGIIGPGHFRFSVAGEPIINLELRLGFTHRGVEKLMEGKTLSEGLRLAEHICGDSSVAHSLAFCLAAEKIAGIAPAESTAYGRAILLELERIYNHVNDIGGIAVDVGFSFPAALASIIKENVLQLSEHLTGSRYLKGMNALGRLSKNWKDTTLRMLSETLQTVGRDFKDLQQILFANVTFMDRVDRTGVVTKKIAEDLGVVGLAGRASGIAHDLRKSFPGLFRPAQIKVAHEQTGDVLARLKVRLAETEESLRLLSVFLNKYAGTDLPQEIGYKEGQALGYCEGWRGPVLYWLKTDAQGRIQRCKIVDPSFHNWQALSYAVQGNIIPDFPLCNKSFDLSYSGNDL